ncbi:MAG TPA: response regulator, partial [Bacteroidota bacterium]|nr:response regulator [Bacteroidota bacterium]
MIVDDEENQLTSMRIALRSAGYDNVRLVSDSRKVIDMLAQETFSLVILDLNMPHVTGHEIIRQSAALEDRPPLVIMTGSHSVEDYADGTSGGVVEYLVKPIDRERLITVVERSLSRPTQFSKSRLTRNYLLSDLITVGSWTPESSVSGGIMDMLEQSR